ncbi:hypothetical protein C8R44DRAFT_648205 [Mycena epipterygia]|nr:hypothetical protein C8R44DRAFT_648205 [Mycena epipterygia]
MHWGGINWEDLFIGMHRGTIRCIKPDTKASWDWAVLQDDVWKIHGQAVADATPYLPGSFDRPPRNPAEKISSGYKAWEYLLYIVGLAPALLLGILPAPYWKLFCKGVNIIRCFHQHTIPVEQIVERHRLAIEYLSEFETLYVQDMPERMHFVRQSIHVMSHLAPEVIRLGPAALYSQWTMERTIGNLGQEMKRHSNPYANLSQRSLRRSQVNALKAMIPDLAPDDDPKLPRGSIDLGGGFILLRARDEHRHHIDGNVGQTIRSFLESKKGPSRGSLSVVRWARLRLPNGQISRSLWKEGKRPLNKVRMARNIDGDDEPEAFAVGDMYSQPDENLLQESYNTVWFSDHGMGEHLVVIPVKTILSVVAMVPLTINGVDGFFLVEKPGLDVISLTDYEEPDNPLQ